MKKSTGLLVLAIAGTGLAIYLGTRKSGAAGQVQSSPMYAGPLVQTQQGVWSQNVGPTPGSAQSFPLTTTPAGWAFSTGVVR